MHFIAINQLPKKYCPHELAEFDNPRTLTKTNNNDSTENIYLNRIEILTVFELRSCTKVIHKGVIPRVFVNTFNLCLKNDVQDKCTTPPGIFICKKRGTPVVKFHEFSEQGTKISL